MRAPVQSQMRESVWQCRLEHGQLTSIHARLDSESSSECNENTLFAKRVCPDQYKCVGLLYLRPFQVLINKSTLLVDSFSPLVNTIPFDHGHTHTHHTHA